MYTYIIIAMTNQGKTFFTRENLLKNNKPCLVFDVNNEYGGVSKGKPHWLNLPTDLRLPRSRYASSEMDVKTFISLAKQRKDSNIVFEEAQGFFKGLMGRDIIQLVIGKWHNRNNYVFVFHTIWDTPRELLALADYVVLFKTGDELDMVRKRSSKLVGPFLKLNRTRNFPDRTPIMIKWQN